MMNQNELSNESKRSELRDNTKIKFFIVDNKIFDIIKNPYSISVYSLLKCFAFNKQTCFPSLNTISYMCGITKPTAIKSIKHLENLDLITVKRKGKRSGNIYILNDISDYEDISRENPELPITQPTSKPYKAGSDIKVATGSVTRPDDVEEGLWQEFVAHRKAKKAPVSDRVVKMFRKEATMADISLTKAIEETLFRGWIGFKAEWFLRRKIPGSDLQFVDSI